MVADHYWAIALAIIVFAIIKYNNYISTFALNYINYSRTSCFKNRQIASQSYIKSLIIRYVTNLNLFAVYTPVGVNIVA